MNDRFTQDLKNILSSQRIDPNNEIITFIKNYQGTELRESSCKCLLELDNIKSDTKIKLEICKAMIENSMFLNLSVDVLTDTLCNNPEICSDQEYKVHIESMLNQLTYTQLDDRSLIKLIDCLELLYVFGNHQYTDKILCLYKRLNNDIKSQQHQPEVIKSKLALLAYGANRYNASENAMKLYELYKRVHTLKLNSLKGAVCYYHWLFYKRTDYKTTYIPLKKQHMCFEAEEELIYRAAKHGYWLAEYVIQ